MIYFLLHTEDRPDPTILPEDMIELPEWHQENYLVEGIIEAPNWIAAKEQFGFQLTRLQRKILDEGPGFLRRNLFSAPEPLDA